MTRTFEIRLGLPDFDEPTLLLVAEPEGFRALADQLLARTGFSLHESSTTLRFVPAEEAAAFSASPDGFEWQLSPAETLRLVGALRALADAGRAAHAYLDPAGNDAGIQVMASVGEYDPDQLFGPAG